MSTGKIEGKYLKVSEIAEKAGVSKNKVWSYIHRNKIKPVKKEKNGFRFDSRIVLEIKKRQENERVKNSSGTGVNGVSDSVLKILEKQLELKDKQIEKQQEIIDYFKNENLSLRLEQTKQRKLLADKDQKLRAISGSGLEERKNKKHWWQF